MRSQQLAAERMKYNFRWRGDFPPCRSTESEPCLERINGAARITSVRERDRITNYYYYYPYYYYQYYYYYYYYYYYNYSVCM
jgi:hypothetical protein